MLRVYHFFFLFWAIFGNDYDSQLGLNRDELDLKKFVEDNNIQTAGSVAAPQNALQEAVEGSATASTPVEGDGAGPAAADVVAPVVMAVHHIISASSNGQPSSNGQAKCCKGATPQCMACQEGISIEIYCADNPVVGCPSQIAPETAENEPKEKEEEQPEPENSPDRHSQDVNINIKVNALPIEQPGHKCTVDFAENNQACPRKAKCAPPEAVSARCGGKEWEIVKEIGDPANCCLKQCNFRCKPVTMPSYGQQNIINTNSMLPKDKVEATPHVLHQVPKENEMERLDYDQESKVVVKPTPKMNDKPKEKPKVSKVSKTIYKKSEKKPKQEKKEKKEKLPPTVSLELFDSSISDDSFTFSYIIANANPNGGFYWTVQRKSTGSLLASTVEKDGETKAPCSGYGKQSDASGVTNVDVDCPFVAGKTYLLWFALDLDTKGGGVYLSPGEPIAFEIPTEPLQKGPKVSTTMSAYSYSLRLNADSNSQPSHLTKLVNAMKEQRQENAAFTAEESAPEPESVQPVMHIVTVDKREEPEEPKETPQEPEETPEQPKEVEAQKEPAQSDEGAPMVVHHIHHVVHHIAGDSQEKESDEEQSDEKEKKEEMKEEEQKEEIKEKVKEAVKEKVKKAVTEAKADMQQEAKKKEQEKQEEIQENVKQAVKSAVKKAKETASNTKKVLKEAKRASEKMSKKAEETSDDDDDDDDDDKKDLKKSLKYGAKQAKKLQKKAEKAHEKAKKAVEKAKEKVEKLRKEKAIFPPKS